MEAYWKQILDDDTPDVLIQHIRCNYIGSKQLTENKIAEWIMKIGRQCKKGNLNAMFLFHH